MTKLNMQKKTIILLLILTVLFALLAAVSCFETRTVEAASTAALSKSGYLLQGKYSRQDDGEHEYPSSGSTYIFGDNTHTDGTNIQTPLHRWMRILISNGTPSSSYSGKSGTGPFRANTLTLTIQEKLKAEQNQSDNQHLCSATLYKDGKEYLTAGKSGNLKDGGAVTMFSFTPESGTYKLKLHYCIDKGWRGGVYGVGWTGWTYESYDFVIDNSAPEWQEHPDNNAIQNSAYISAKNENGNTLYLNGTNLNSHSTFITTEGKHTYYAKDDQGNTTSPYYLWIDKTSPTGTLSGVSNGGITNKNVYFSQSTATTATGSTAKSCDHDTISIQYRVNSGSWLSYANKTTLSEDGKYEIRITDRAGNISTYTFEIDKTAPTGTLSGVANGGITNETVSFSWSDSRSSAKLNGSSYSKGSSISTEGVHTIILTDTAGNSTTYTFEIDKSAPLPSIYTSSGTALTDGGITNQDVYFTWNDNRATAEYKINNGAWTEYLKSYYRDRRYPDVQYKTKDSALLAIGQKEESATVEIMSWTGEGTVYAADIQYAQTGSPCWKYDNTIFFQGSSLATYRNSKISSFLENVTKNLFTQSATYYIALRDTAGNITQRSFEIDKTAPTGTLSGLTNEAYMLSNKTVTFSWTEASATAALNGATYTKSSAITAEGKHTIILTDRAGNSSTYTFEIDKTAPTGTLSGVANGGITNKTVTFSWTEASATATLNGATYTKSSAITAEGKHTIVLTDRAGNSSTYTFEIDKTAPTGTLSGVTNGGITNKTVTFSWTEATATAALNGATYANGSDISAEGRHTIILTDRAGNSTTYTFEIDKTAPTGTFAGLTNKEYMLSNKTVTFSWTEATATATLNGATYTKSSAITAEGQHTIVLTDRAGNSTTYSFEIDKTAPTGTLSGLTNEAYMLSNKTVTFSWTEALTTATVSLNGDQPTQFQNNAVFTTAGKYALILTDAAGNSTTYSFEIDKTAPTGTFTGLTNKEYMLSNKTITFSWTEATATAALNGATYANGSDITAEGKHTIILTDTAGNSTTYSFEIDKTAPTGTLSGVANGGITNQDVYFSWDSETYSAILNSKNFISGTGVSAEGRHTIVLTDRAGNSTTYSFEIDKTSPTGTLSGLTNEAYMLSNKTVTFSWTEASATATLNGVLYTKDTKIAYENTYEIVLTDRAGNSTTYLFEIDVTPPSGSLLGVDLGGVTNKSVSFVWDEDGALATLNNQLFSSGNTITAEGRHTIILTDRAGNSTTYTFEIDKTAPTGTLSGVANNGATKTTVSFTWTEVSATATLNGSSYTRNSAILAEGMYIIVLTDIAGNSTTYNFEIDKTAPTGTLSIAGNLIGEIAYVNQDVYFTWLEATAFAEISLNNSPFKSYKKGDTLSSEGIYVIKLYDAVGNFDQFSFCIDKTAFTQNKNNIMSNYVCHINKWYETFSYRLDNNKYIENVTYSFTNYDDTLRYSINRERAIIESHSEYLGGNIFCDFAKEYVSGTDISSTSAMLGQPYYIYKSLDNPSKLIAYFKESNLETAINKYAERSVSIKYLPNSPSTPYPGDNYISAQQIFRSQIYVKDTTFTLPYRQAEGYLYINGNLSDYSQSLNTGLNLIREIDYAGNVTEYSIVLDISAPQILCEDAVGNVLSEYENLLNSEREAFYFDKELKISLLDNYDENCLLTITLDGATFNIIGNKYDLSVSGIYTFTVRDIAGNTKRGTIYLSLEPPTVSITENLTAQSRLESFNVNITKNLQFNTIVSIEVLRRDSNNVEYLKVSTDDKGAEIKSNTLSYTFVTNGDYIIKIIDNYYRETIYEYSFIKEAPVGSLYTRSGGILKSGSITNQDVYFAWTDKTCIAYYIVGDDGVEIEYPIKEYISASGKYTILLKDVGNNTSVYTFEIDKTAPNSGKIYYIDPESNTQMVIANKSKTNQSVYFSYDTVVEANAVVRYTIGNSDKWILYSGEKLTADGTYTIQLIDRAGNTTSYQFTIDTIAPLVTIKTTGNQLLNNNAVTNKAVRFIFDEPNVLAKVNQEDYTSGTILREAGTYSLYVEDACGNFSTYFVTIDLTPPDGTLSGVANGGITNQDISFSWKEDELSLYVNGKLIDKNTANSKEINFSEEKKYELILTDRAGNSTTYTFEIDKTAPTGTLSGVTNGGITNKTVSFTWAENTVTATLNDEAYSSNTNIRNEGKYILVLLDRAGNSTTYTFEIDLTPPEGLLKGVVNGGITNQDVYFTWTEESATASLNLIEYKNNQSIFAESKYTLILTDRAGNSTTYTFEIDKTAPTGTLSGVTNGGITNKTVSFTWAENTVTATLNDEAYSSNTNIRNEGKYTLVLLDRAGNSTTYTFEIDKTAPTGTLSGLTNETYMLSNKTVTFSWTEATATAALNGATYANGSDITAEGIYTIAMTDAAGNSTTYTFEIDKTSPTGTLSGLTNETYMLSNKTVTFSWTEATATATLNGATYTKSSAITAEGQHTIVLTDRAGNSTTYSFEIDKTAPTGTLSGLTNEEYSLSNNSVTFSWSDDTYYAIVNSLPVYNNFVIENEGKHTIILMDRAGNSTTYSFEIDKTAPTGTLSGLTNEAYMLSNKTVTFSWTEASATATLNGQLYTKSSAITAEGQHTIVLTDRAGNSTTYSFEIDKTAPLFFVYDIDNNTTAGFYFNTSISINWSEENLVAYLNAEEYSAKSLIVDNGLYSFTLTDLAGNISPFNFTIKKTAPIGTFNESYSNHEGVCYFKNTATFSWEDNNCTATLNGEIYEKGTIVRSEGIYTIVLTDRAGNSSTYTFEIDKTAPTGTLSGLTNTQLLLSNKTVIFSWEENTSVASLNNDYYVNGSAITAEGRHTIILTDRAGNSTTYTFEIDYSSPAAILTGVVDNGITNSSVRISWEENYLTVTLNEKTISNNTTVSSNGKYTLILTDRAGNSSTYSFEIDKTLPTGTLSGVINGGITNQTVTFSWTEATATATLNGFNYLSGELIENDGNYEIILSSKSGNTVIYVFEIDKTAPTGTLSGLTNETYMLSNKTVTFSWTETSATATLNGKNYSNQTIISAAGQHTIVLTDRAGNSTTYSFEIDKTAPTGTLSGLTNEAYMLSNKTVTFSWTEESATTTLNGATYINGSDITAEGRHTIILTDRAGNSTTYTFEIDKTAPTGKVEGLTNEDTLISNKSVTFSWIEADCTATVNNDTFFTSSFVSEKEGVYIIILTDRAGNSSTYSFEIIKTAPTGTFSGLTNEKYLLSNNVITFEWINSDYTAVLNGEPYDRLSEITAERKHILVLTDAAGNSTTYTFEIDKTAPTGTLSGLTNETYMLSNKTVTFSWTEATATATLNGATYTKSSAITAEGKHTIVLTDRAGNSTIYSFEIDKTAPTGTLSGLTNEAYMLSNKTVAFSWTEATAIATLNGEIYINGKDITAEGKYTIILIDLSGNKSVYEFEIDKTAPVADIENGFITNKSVKISWEENYLNAILNFNEGEEVFYSRGDTIRNDGNYVFILTDRAGNSSTYSFEIRRTPPVSDVITEDGNYFNMEEGKQQNISQGFYIPEGPYTITVNNEIYEAGTIINNVGRYEIVLTDELGNTLNYAIRIIEIEEEKQNKNIAANIILYILIGLTCIGIFIKIILSKLPHKQKIKH